MARRARDRSGPHGLLVVDKPEGPTSHDVVALARRALGTRRVGHAGTLDPMATGVLVLLFGEATKLAPYVTAADKTYSAEVRLGVATHTLDADAPPSAWAPVPYLRPQKVERALQSFVGTHDQRAPAVSALKVKGRALHARLRRGETVQPPVRQVVLHEATLLSLAGDRIRLRVRCGKGFYVRSLARDLALELGTVGHLSRLRRERSGALGLDDAVGFELLRRAGGDARARRQLLEASADLAGACRQLPTVIVSDEGAEHARHGRAVPVAAASGSAVGPCALLTQQGEPVAIAAAQQGGYRVLRGLLPTGAS